MRRIRLRSLFWILGWGALFILLNTERRIFPHILLIFWTILPILSILYSRFAARKLSVEESVEPRAVSQGQEVLRAVRVSNASFLMPFLVTLPLNDPSTHKRASMLIPPRCSRTFGIRFTLADTGVIAAEAGKEHRLSYEDLLGFILLPLHQMVAPLDVMVLPTERVHPAIDAFAGHLGGKERAKDARADRMHSEEVFSVDPWREGESLSRAHWKLSARYQQWMIRHYSDIEHEPQQLFIDVHPVEAPVLPVEEEVTPSNSALQERTAFLDTFYTFCLALLDRGNPLTVVDRANGPLLLQNPSDRSQLAERLASLPFGPIPAQWHFDVQEKAPIFWIQTIDASMFGRLLSWHQSGISMIVLSFRTMNDPALIEKIDQSAINVLWIDEDIA